jgi:hypothetical protein
MNHTEDFTGEITPFPESTHPAVTWATTLASTASNAPEFSGLDGVPTRFGKLVVSASGDLCGSGSWIAYGDKEVSSSLRVMSTHSRSSRVCSALGASRSS